MPRFENGTWGWRSAPGIRSAAGIQFLCPKCYAANGSPVGTHTVICWGPEVDKGCAPSPGRWVMIGGGFYDLTLNGTPGKSRSVLLKTEGGCRAHFYVTGGMIQFC